MLTPNTHITCWACERLLGEMDRHPIQPIYLCPDCEAYSII